MIAEGQRLDNAGGKVVFHQPVAGAPAWLTVIGLDNLVDLAVIFRTLYGLLQNEIFPCRSYRPFAFRQIFGEHLLGSRHHILFY